MNTNILELKNVVKYFPIYGGIFSRTIAKIQAVRGVSFNIKEGETVGLVGESGCGKSTLARSIARLYKPDDGEIFFNGNNIFKLKKKTKREMAQKMQMIFQDPYASLNPRMTIEDIISEPFIVHKLYNKQTKNKKIEEMLMQVGLSKDAMNRYPHEFSGGQRQRIGIARALAVNPKFIICDEPVSALDVSIQAQIINLLIDLQEKYNLTYLFISHDLKIVQYVTNKIIIMYLGKIMEIIESSKLLNDALHPYTKALISAIPIEHPKIKQKRIILTGDIPSSISPPSGCSFRTRCWMAEDICKKEEPILRNIDSKVHLVSCHLV